MEMFPAIWLPRVLSCLPVAVPKLHEYRQMTPSKKSTYLCLPHICIRFMYPRLGRLRDSWALRSCGGGVRGLPIHPAILSWTEGRRPTASLGSTTDRVTWLSYLLPNQVFFYGSWSGMLRNGKQFSGSRNTNATSLRSVLVQEDNIQTYAFLPIGVKVRLPDGSPDAKIPSSSYIWTFNDRRRSR